MHAINHPYKNFQYIKHVKHINTYNATTTAVAVSRDNANLNKPT